jgi:sphingomyelin phosphodiesterase acid-like 3
LNQARNLTPFDFIIVTGDFGRHGNDQLENPMNATQQILSNVSQLLVEAFGDTRIVPSLGNNDVTPDYYLDVDNATEGMLTMVSRGLGALLQTNDERASFLRGGFLSCNVTNTITILSLNTIIYSTDHLPVNQLYEDPLGQFVWLERQLELAQASNRAVYITGHIPPAVGSFEHYQLWQDQYLSKYYELLAKYQGVVMGQLFGHLHSDEFRLTKVGGFSYPLLLAPSITPIYGNNPSIRVVRYEQDSGLMLDYDTYYLDLTSDTPEWRKGASFQDSFPVLNLSSISLEHILANLTNSSESPLWEEVVSRQHVYADEADQCNVKCRQEWICTFQSMSRKDYNTCLEQSGSSSSSSSSSTTLKILVGLLIGGACWGVAWILLKRYRRRQYYEPQSQDGVVLSLEDEGVSSITTTTNGRDQEISKPHPPEIS